MGEKVKLLTDETKSVLNQVVNLNIMQYFRNVIDHDYESVNVVVLVASVSFLLSDGFLKALYDRAKYCDGHRRE